MSYEILVSLQVNNDEVYAQYREAMQPLLERAEGGIRYDFKVAEVLKNEEKRPINRVFAIYFGDREKMGAFFSDPNYLAIKRKYFEASVEAFTIISEYARE